MDALKEFEQACLKHLQGKHNQKRHGWRYTGDAVANARSAMRGQDAGERGEYRKRAGMAEPKRVEKRQAESPIGDLEPIEIKNEKSKSGGGQWRYTTLEAKSGAEAGTIEFGYPRGKLTDINRNTTQATYKIKAGVYDLPGYRRLTSHNINWGSVKKVIGETYKLRDFLKEQGFQWNGSEWNRL